MDIWIASNITNTGILNNLEYIPLNTPAGTSIGLIPELKMHQKFYKFVIR